MLRGRGGDRAGPVPQDWMDSLLSLLGCGQLSREKGLEEVNGALASCSLLTEAILAVPFSFFLEKLLLFLHFQLHGIIFFD